MKRILFVCTGNTCRSPMAQGMLLGMADKEKIPLEVRSAGLHAMDGMPISSQTADILKDNDFPAVSGSTALARQHIDWAELILTMTMSHKQELIQRYPDALDKTFTLKEYVEDDPEQIAKWKERERFIGETEMKLALSEPLTDEEKAKLAQYEEEPPDLDIHDPIGGSAEVYQQCADEIGSCLKKLLKKWKSDT